MKLLTRSTSPRDHLRSPSAYHFRMFTRLVVLELWQWAVWPWSSNWSSKNVGKPTWNIVGKIDLNQLKYAGFWINSFKLINQLYVMYVFAVSHHRKPMHQQITTIISLNIWIFRMPNALNFFILCSLYYALDLFSIDILAMCSISALWFKNHFHKQKPMELNEIQVTLWITSEDSRQIHLYTSRNKFWLIV